MRGEYERALLSFEQWLEREPTNPSAQYWIGLCYRHLQDFAKAEAHVEKALRRLPFEPAFHQAMALVYADMGRREDALEHLETALGMWKDADPEFKPAQEARQKLEELSSAP